MKKQIGFILITVLIILQILFLLAWYALQGGLLSFKMSRELYQWQITWDATSLQLENIENVLQKNSVNCIIPITPFIEIKNNLNDWPQNRVCEIKIGDMDFRYVIEILGKNPCHLIQNMPKKIVQYVRVTLRARSSDESQIFLQSTIARPIISVEICDDVQQFVLPGRQFWRQG